MKCKRIIKLHFYKKLKRFKNQSECKLMYNLKNNEWVMKTKVIQLERIFNEMAKLKVLQNYFKFE